jgi:peptidoglycan/xylan/chitin deacetylase (PgdA/CDA1 family)
VDRALAGHGEDRELGLGSRYEAVIRLPSSGSWQVRAVHSDRQHAPSYSAAQSIRVTDWRARYVGRKVGGFRTSKKLVAITIDDGPNQRTLDACTILERYGGKGTFFFTESLLRRGYGSQARKVYSRGHEIANHTVHHSSLTGSFSHSYYEANSPKGYIRKVVGFSPTWVRAMGGGIDSTGMRAVVRSGQLYCNWSIDSYDSHARYTPPSVLYHNVVDHVGRGDVILIHQTHPETLRALPSISGTQRRATRWSRCRSWLQEQAAVAVIDPKGVSRSVIHAQP